MHHVLLEDNLANVPVWRAQLDVLLLLAEGIHEHRLELLHAARSNPDRRTWIHYVDVLATTYADPDEYPYFRQRSDVLNVLGRFESTGVVRTSPRAVIDAVNHVRDTIAARLQSGAEPLTYLARANERAHKSIMAFVQKHHIVSDLGPKPAGLRLRYSSSADESCAVSVRVDDRDEIVWTVGPTELAFWAAIQPEMVLQHEYLSHFAPRHPRLSARVREGWLMEALIEEVEGASKPTRAFDVGLFNYLRDQLEDALARHSTPGARDLPLRIRRINAALYWDMTRAMIGLTRDDMESVEPVDELLGALGDLSRANLEAAIEGYEWSGFEGFLRHLSR